jgi:DNA-directed RNA polymerase sigma subunit (sigma70/sigma32)
MAAVAALRKRMTPGILPEDLEDITKEEQASLDKLARFVAPDVVFIEDLSYDFPSTDHSELPRYCTDPQNAEDSMLTNEQVHLLAHLLAYDHPMLSTREKLVIRHRYGVFGHEKLTLEMLAKKFRALGWRATKEWIHQLEKRALRKIQEQFCNLGFA